MELRAISPLYKKYWRDIGSQAYTGMKLKEVHYFRRFTNDHVYFCFGCARGESYYPHELFNQKINCYNCKKEFIFKGPFNAVIKCEDCRRSK